MLDRDFLIESLPDMDKDLLIDKLIGLSDEILEVIFPEYLLHECNNCNSNFSDWELDRDGNCSECAEWQENRATCERCWDEFECAELDEHSHCIDCMDATDENDKDEEEE